MFSQECEDIYINSQQYSLFDDQFNIFEGQDIILDHMMWLNLINV